MSTLLHALFGLMSETKSVVELILSFLDAIQLPY